MVVPTCCSGRIQLSQPPVPRGIRHRFGAHATASERWAILHRHPLGLEVLQHSVTPGFLRGALDTASRHEAAVQGSDGPVQLRFTGAVTCGCGDVAGVLAVTSVPSADPGIFRRVADCSGTWRHQFGMGQTLRFRPLWWRLCADGATPPGPAKAGRRARSRRSRYPRTGVSTRRRQSCLPRVRRYR